MKNILPNGQKVKWENFIIWYLLKKFNIEFTTFPQGKLAQISSQINNFKYLRQLFPRIGKECFPTHKNSTTGSAKPDRTLKKLVYNPVSILQEKNPTISIDPEKFVIKSKTPSWFKHTHINQLSKLRNHKELLLQLKKKQKPRNIMLLFNAILEVLIKK